MGGMGSLNFSLPAISIPEPIIVIFNYQVRIKSINLAGIPVSGMKVDLVFNQSTGSGITDGAGNFLSQVFQLTNASSSAIRIKVTDPATGFIFYDGSQNINNSGTATEIPIVIDRYFVVKGKALLTDNSPLPKLKIEATDKTPGLSTPLAPVIETSETGQYQITFWTHNLVKERNRNRPNLVMRVFNPGGELIATSDIVNATGNDEVNFSIKPEVYGGPSEFDRFYKIVQPLLADVRKDGLDANDLVLLSTLTGGDISQMNHLLDAVLLSTDTNGLGIAAEWLYGLFRMGLSSKLPQLADVSRARFDAALKDAVEQRIITSDVLAEANTIYNQLLKFKAGSDLTSTEDPEAESMLGLVLSWSGLEPGEQAELYLAYLTAENRDDAFWNRAFEKKLINKEQLNKIPLYLKLAFVCEREKGIFEVLIGKYNPDHINNLSVLEYEDWFDIVQEARAKNKIPHIQQNEDAAYIRKFLNKAYEMVPTATLVYLVKKEETVRDNAWLYLEDNLRQFDFKNQNINTYIDLHPETLDNYKNDIENLRMSLNRIQRTFLLTPSSYRPVLTKALLDLGLDAAGKILRIGEITFVKYYKEGLQLDNLSDKIKEEHAILIFQRARKQANLIRHLHSTYGTSFNSLPMYAVQQTEDRRKDRVHIPGFSTLFEAQEVMVCDHCNSVLSPAAYLIDLLAFLDEAEIDRVSADPSSFNETALDILFERRPDIKNLVLNCENTNTPVSYIDLVNEVLENAIAVQLEDNSATNGQLQYRLRGKVVTTTTTGKQVPVKDAYVQLFSAAASHQQLLGSAQTDRYGKFSVTIVPDNHKPLVTTVKVIDQHQSLRLGDNKIEWNSAKVQQQKLFVIDYNDRDSDAHPKQLLYLKSNDIWTISGYLWDNGGNVANSTGSPLRKYLVMAWDEDYGGDDLLGMCETDEIGYFEINFHSSAYMDGNRDALPDPYIVVINEGRIIYLQYLGSNVKDNMDLGIISMNPKTRTIKRLSSPTKGYHNISGVIKGTTGSPLAGLRVVLTNNSLRSAEMSPTEEFAIGITATDKNGIFSLSFDESEWKTPAQQTVGPYQLIVNSSDLQQWIVNVEEKVSIPAGGILPAPTQQYTIAYSGVPPTTGDRITGKVINQYTGQPVQNMLVEVWRSEGENDYWVGNAISSAPGDFIVPTKALVNKVQISLFFKLFDQDNFLYQSYPWIYDVTGPAGAKTVKADVLNPYHGDIKFEPLQISGRVLDKRTSRPLKQTSIALWEKDKGKDHALIQFGARTDDDGNFTIRFEFPHANLNGISRTWHYKIFIKDRISFEPAGTFSWSYKDREKQISITVDTSAYSFGIAKEYYTIQGKLMNKENGQPLRGCSVEAWDKDETDGDDLLGIARSDINGYYEIIFDSHYFRDKIEDNDPDVYFKVYQGTQLILREEVIADMKTKVLMKDLHAIPAERLEISGQRGPLKGNVYKTLAETLYPWSFPFNLHEAEAHLYLKSLGLDKEQLITALNPGKDTRLGEALAYLKMSREELESLKTTSVKLLYGLGDDVPVTLLSDVPFVLSTIRISFDELKELIQTDYVNPLKKEIRFLTDGTELDLSRSEYVNLHRLSRIKSKGDWKASELEQIIRLFERRYGELKGSNIDRFIIYLANFRKLTESGTSLSEVLSWQFDLHLFRNSEALYFNIVFDVEPVAVNGSAPIFLLQESGQALVNSGRSMLNENGQLSEITSPVMAALGIEPGSMVVLVKECLPDSAINVTNLSRLYRIVSFCRHLGIGYEQYRQYVACIGFDPMALSSDKNVVSTEIIVKFVEELNAIRKSGLTLDNLKFLHSPNALLNGSAETDALFQSLREASLRENPEARPGVIIRNLSEALDLKEDLITVLVSEVVLMEKKSCKIIELFISWFESAGTRSVEFDRIMEWLQQWNSLAQTFRLEAHDVAHILKFGASSGWYYPHLSGLQSEKANQTFIAWKSVITACRLNKVFKQKNKPSLFSLVADNWQWSSGIASLTQLEIANKKESFLANVSAITDWNLDDIRFLATQIHQWQYPSDFLGVNWFDQLSRDFKFLAQSGMLPSQIPQMQSVALHNIDDSQAGILQLALKSKTPPGQWEEKINRLKDQVREQQRSALQTYLLSRDVTLQNADDIYAQYLVDTEVGTTIQTSRIRQSISSVQLLVQRIRMGLEPGVSFKREDMKEWEWRKTYRVWEANRKIFLYPENWLEPELRDDQSQFFKKFEEELMQGEINADNVEKAFRNYMIAMDEVAHLEISGHCYQADENIYHVFARTRNLPHRYFYRRWIQEYYWTPWEEVQLDIVGDHLVPVYWNRKLLLFWPSFAEKAEESNTTQTYNPSPTAPVKGSMPKMKLEVKLFISQWQNGGWTAKKLSEAKLRFDYPAVNTLAGEPSYPLMLFQTITSEEKLSIRAYRDSKEMGIFVLQAGTNEIVTSEGNLNVSSVKFPLDEVKPFTFSKFSSSGQLKINGQGILNAPGSFSITPVPEQTALDLALYYENQDKTYVLQKIKSLPADLVGGTTSAVSYRFNNFFHPLTGFLKSMLDRYGAVGLFNPPRNDNGNLLIGYLRPNSKPLSASASFEAFSPSNIVLKPYPSEGLSFDLTDAYASYNWELFFHAPVTIAVRLSQNQKFEEAQQWFHYIFDPTETEGEAPSRFWRIKPFFQFTDYSNIADIIKALNSDREEYTRQVENWERDPFNPHVIARLRIVAYMRMVVMKYLDNLIAWGDQLFQRDTIESVNEATQIYILASQILGKKPSFLQQDEKEDLTVRDIFDNLDNFSNALIEVENKLPNIDFQDMAREENGPEDNANTFGSLLYFCIPQNDFMLKYWETVSDRLYKIRQGLNIEGLKRAQVLFDPPIDPGMLVKAAAMGVSLTSATGDLDAGLCGYRFSYLLPKAIELCSDVKSLGGSLLSALEKKDSEQMALLRSTHEIALLKAVKEIKKKSIEDAETSVLSLYESLKSARKKLAEYDRRIKQNVTPLEIAQVTTSVSSMAFKVATVGLQSLATGLSVLPTFKMGISGAFGSPVAQLGTPKAQAAAEKGANLLQSAANVIDSAGSIIGMYAAWERRREDWQLQRDLAIIEVDQVQQQINGAILRQNSAIIDLRNHEKQIEQAQEVRDLMESKFTNQQLYHWMVGQLSTVYFQSYQLAFDLAKKAEKAYAHELGVNPPGIIEFGYWDSLKKGLLSGERLQLDLRRLEVAFMEQNKREFELTKHISLALFNSEALLDLREKGVCEFDIPEILFGMDHPSHYMRRIRSVSLTIPCITGPYTGIHAKLTLLASRVRKSTSLEGGYAYKGVNDPRFNHDITDMQSIATSSGQNDSGIFELNFRDERYLPFERAGAISQWRLELPAAIRQFNYDSISDVIIHLNYTAREGGEQLKVAVEEDIQTSLNTLTNSLAATGTGLQAWISLRTDFSTIFNQLLGKAGNKGTVIEITPRYFPYFLRDRELKGKAWTVMIKSKDDPDLLSDVKLSLQLDGKKIERKSFVGYKDAALLYQADFKSGSSPIGKWKLQFESEDLEKINLENIDDIWLISDYTIVTEEEEN